MFFNKTKPMEGVSHSAAHLFPTRFYCRTAQTAAVCGFHGAGKSLKLRNSVNAKYIEFLSRAFTIISGKIQMNLNISSCPLFSNSKKIIIS